jgi:hypothetical protein
MSKKSLKQAASTVLSIALGEEGSVIGGDEWLDSLDALQKALDEPSATKERATMSKQDIESQQTATLSLKDPVTGKELTVTLYHNGHQAYLVITPENECDTGVALDFHDGQLSALVYEKEREEPVVNHKFKLPA